MYAPLQPLVGAGIKLVIVDTGLEDQSDAVSVISSDNVGGGKQAADLLGTQIGGKGSVFVMNVSAGITTTDQRAKGFIDEMKAKYPDVKVLDTQYNADDPAKAASITTSVLSAHPDLAGVFATNVQGAEGTATGLKQAGKAGAVKVISYDAGPQQVKDLNDGTVQGLIAQDPYTEGIEQPRAGGERTVRQAGDQGDPHGPRRADQGQPHDQRAVPLQELLLRENPARPGL